MEHTLDKLVVKWYHTQPAHLRHLAVLRDVQMEGKTISYIHYAFETFKRLVETNRTIWDAVLPRKDDMNAMIDRIIGQGSLIPKDEFGFPQISAPPFQYRSGLCTLGQTLRPSKPQKKRRYTRGTKSDKQDGDEGKLHATENSWEAY